MTFDNSKQICGLGVFAKKAAAAGYTNPNGTVNLIEAQQVCKKFGKLVPKNELDEQTLKELKETAQKMQERFNPSKDSFVKNCK